MAWCKVNAVTQRVSGGQDEGCSGAEGGNDSRV